MMSSKNKYIIMNNQDNCATTLDDLPQGETLNIRGNTIVLNQPIALGHKLALEDIPSGKLVYKYGQIIGITTKAIQKGEWIHIHNLKSHYLEMVSK